MRRVSVSCLLMLFFLAAPGFSQNDPDAALSAFVSATGSFASVGPLQGSTKDMFKVMGSERNQMLSLSPAASIFIFKGLFIGGEFSYSYDTYRREDGELTAGLEKSREGEFSTTSVGPHSGHRD